MEGLVGVGETFWISKKMWRFHLFGRLEGQESKTLKSQLSKGLQSLM